MHLIKFLRLDQPSTHVAARPMRGLALPVRLARVGKIYFIMPQISPTLLLSS